jgi:hypothetical protein
MHKSEIIISSNPKIMINSQDVPFDITRQCAQVGLKNMNILNMKIIYAVLSEIEKHFSKMIYIITLCNFWHSIYSYPNSQHIQSSATEKLYISSCDRSKYNTFVIFLPKLF